MIVWVKQRKKQNKSLY